MAFGAKNEWRKNVSPPLPPRVQPFLFYRLFGAYRSALSSMNNLTFRFIELGDLKHLDKGKKAMPLGAFRTESI